MFRVFLYFSCMKKTISLLFVFSVILLSSCLKDKTEPVNVASGECDTIVSYSADIRPIIESSCKTGLGGGTGCHDAWIDNYDPIESYIVAGTWQNVVLTEKTMPIIPNDFGIDSLTAEEIQTMKCWIDQGYPEN